MKIGLKQNVLDTIIATPKLQLELAEELGRSLATIYRIAKSNNDDLTKVAALRTISKFTGIKEKDLLQENGKS